MLKILIQLFLFISSLFLSQTNRFIYELEYKEYRFDDKPIKKNMVLDINPEDVKYYDYSFLEKDSINKIYNHQNTNWTDQIPVIRKKNSVINFNYVEIGELYFYETKDELNWKLENETKKIDQFEAQKASLNFGGRNWEAWFTRDIPFQEGPYKFRGLPGLILEIKDDKNNFVFSLAKIQKLPITYDTSNIIEVRYGDKPIKITEKIARKKAKDYFDNPFNSIIQGLNNGKITYFEYNGAKYNKANELPKLTKQVQQEILEEYNPIEIDKSLYPININYN